MTLLPLEFTPLRQVLQEGFLEATLCLSLTFPVRRSHSCPTVSNLKSASESAAQLPYETGGWQKWT